MSRVEVAVLAALVRSRRHELRLTRRECTAAGGPPIATLNAIERGRLTHPSESILSQLDAALAWPPGTARAALSSPTQSTAQHTTAALTLRQRKLLYSELADRRAAPEAVTVAGEMLAQALRVELRHAIATADVDVLLEIDKLLRTPPQDEPTAATEDPKPPPRRRTRPQPEIWTTDGITSLRELRLNHGWSLDDVATKITALQQLNNNPGTVSRGTLSAIETGQRGMSTTMAQHLEHIYNLPPATLPTSPRTSTRHPRP
jgi:DNA-binding XRE family transcriptional regulator